MYELYPDVLPDGAAPEETGVEWGNADCSKEENFADRCALADAVLLAKAIGGGAELSVQGSKNADVKNDGTVDGSDLTQILKYLAGLIPYSDLGQK